MIQLPKVLTGYFSTSKLNSAFTLIENWLNNNVVHRKDGSAVMEQTLDMNGNPIINTTVGTDPSSLVNKNYVDRVLPELEKSVEASVTKAADHALKAVVSETKASESALKAAKSAAKADNSVLKASISETKAANYASAAATSKTKAADSALEAAKSEATASNHASKAAKNKTFAAEYALKAAVSETNAANSASKAAKSETNAANSASKVIISETNAANYAAEAAISETNAANSEQLAFQHEQDALIHLKNFRGTYFGAYSSAPTTDPDGNPVNAGDLYFDTILNEMRVYDGSVWKAAGATVNGTSKRFHFTGNGVKATFTIPGGYDATYADVYVNGVKLVNGVDVDVSSGKDIVFTKAPINGDNIDVIAYGSFQLADVYTKSDFTYYIAPNGCQKLPSGLIIQWGHTTAHDVTFPIAFPNAVLSAVATKGVLTNTSANTPSEVAIDHVTLRGMKVHAYYTGIGYVTNQGVSWMAIGH